MVGSLNLCLVHGNTCLLKKRLLSQVATQTHPVRNLIHSSRDQTFITSFFCFTLKIIEQSKLTVQAAKIIEIPVLIPISKRQVVVG